MILSVITECLVFYIHYLTWHSQHPLLGRQTLLLGAQRFPGETCNLMTSIWGETELRQELRALSDLKFYALSYKRGDLYV